MPWEHVYFTPWFYSVVIHWLEGMCIIHVCFVAFVLYAWCTNRLVDTKLRQCQRFEGKFDFNLKRLLEREYARFDWNKKKKKYTWIFLSFPLCWVKVASISVACPSRSSKRYLAIRQVTGSSAWSLINGTAGTPRQHAATMVTGVPSV